MKTADLSTALGTLVVALEFVIVVLMGRLNHTLDRQLEVLNKVEGKIDEEFNAIEQRINSLLSDFNREVKDVTRANFHTRQFLQTAKNEIVAGLEKMKGSVLDLRRSSIELSKKLPSD